MVAVAGEGRDHGVMRDRVPVGHLVEQLAGRGEVASAAEGREESVVGVLVFEGEVGEGGNGGGEGAGEGVEVDEAVGEDGVAGEGGLEEVAVEVAAEPEVFGGNASLY